MPDRGESCFFFAGCFEDASEISVVSLQRFTCFDYSMQLLRSDRAPMWVFNLDCGYSLMHYAARLYLHAATSETLKRVMRAVGVQGARTTNLHRITAILEHCQDIPQETKDACVARATALAAKRRRNTKAKAGGATCDEAADEKSDGSECDASPDPVDLGIPPILLRDAAKEVAFVCGRASASDAINEEEGDEGIAEARAMLKRGATSKRARTVADEPPTQQDNQDQPRI